MAQNVLDYTYDPTGNELMDEYLPKMAENCLTNNSGIARPTYAVENTVWVDTSDDDTWRYKIYDGTSDIVLFELDNITKKINFPNITGVFRFKGSVATVSALPATGNLPGDVYNVIDGGANYAWNDSEWDKLSENLEWGRIVGTLSNQTDLQNALNAKQATLVSGTNIKTINNNSILGSGNLDIDGLPSQTGQSGKVLTTDGTDASWADVDALPSQTGQSGKYLTTDGSSASWATLSVNPDNKSITTNSSDELQTVGVINSRDSSIAVKTWTGTKAQYDAIVTKDANTLYNITDDTDVSLTILEALYPVGSVYITTANTCPLSALISGSTWELVSSGRVLQGADSGHSAGTTIEAGLPNITGTLGLGVDGGDNKLNYVSSTGALTTTSYSGKASTTGDTTQTVCDGVNLDASLSNSIYGNSTTVQPPAYVVNIYRRTA